MTRIRIRVLIPVAFMLFSALSCSLFMADVKPTQGVDLAPMVGKSLLEMSTLLGNPKASGLCHAWDLPEGRMSACYRTDHRGKQDMETLHYTFPPAQDFEPRMAVSSPEEMSALVKIELQGRKPDTTIQGGYGYHNYVVNGKTVNLFFDGGPKTIVGVRVDVK